MQTKTRKRIGLAIFLVFTLTGIYLLPGLRHQGFTGTADWVDACGRSYDYDGGDLWHTKSEMIKENPGIGIVGTVQVRFSHLNIWGVQTKVKGLGGMCARVFVEYGEDRFLLYELMGGV